jgi:hypothetical protein
MDKVIYTGFSGQRCACNLATIPSNVLPGGAAAFVFTQTHESTTSVTNCVEQISSVVLRTLAANTHPKQLRFFEYYPPASQPLIVWQEVTFAGIFDHFHVDTGWSRFMRRFNKAQPDFWSVAEPIWHPVGRPLQAQLVEFLDAPIHV